MDHPSPKQSPDKSDVRPSFLKPSQDAANRKYRRHTPVGGSGSSASEGSPLRQSHSPAYSEDRLKKDGGRDLERNSNHTWSSRGSDSYRHSDRQSYRTSHDYTRNSDSSRHNRHADETGRGYQRPPRSDRESRNDTRSDYPRHANNSDSYRGTWRTGDKYCKDKSDSLGHRAKEKDHRPDNREFDKAAFKGRQKDLSRDDTSTGEQDRHRDGKPQGERRDRHRSPTDYKNDRGSYREELKGHAKDSTLGRDRSSIHSKDTLWSDSKESDALREKRKYNDRESLRRKEKSTREAESEMRKDTKSSGHKDRDRKNERSSDKFISVSEDQNSSKKLKHGFPEGPLSSKSIAHEADEKASSSKHVKETAEKVTSEPARANITEVETCQDLDAAKVAAMKAAELVNRNLVGGSYMSTDQKKKLLWGNKKSTTTEESGNRWDLQLFSDRERQEKFNKLMSLRLPWYLWPIVGCEGRHCTRLQTRQEGRKPSSRAGATRDGLGEAIHCWAPQKRWPDGWPWPVVMVTVQEFLFLHQDTAQLLSCKHNAETCSFVFGCKREYVYSKWNECSALVPIICVSYACGIHLILLISDLSK